MRRSLWCVALCLGALASLPFMSGAALAQTTEKQPVIDWAHRRLHYLADGAIAGHLEGWVQGDQVTLLRSEGDEWVPLRSRVVDERGRVRFELSSMRQTRLYRLAYTDPGTGEQSLSRGARVRVTPHLTIRLSTNRVMEGRTITAFGRLLPRSGARSVSLRQKVGGEWRSLGTAYVRDGRYALRFEARHTGFRSIRAVFRGDDKNTAATVRTRLRVYDPARATWYGPGFYGNRTACGQTLTTGTVGVAHRWLPCGTKVSVLYEGRTIVVPVIDRGPYANAADWDLTEEAAERLRFYGTDTIGVVRRP